MANVQTIQNKSESGGNKSIYKVNPLGGDPVDNKDLFIYANLTATKNNRSVLVTNTTNSPNNSLQNRNEDGFEVNLIGYKKDNNGNHFMTTDWSSKLTDPTNNNNISGSITTLSNNVFEGFGITDINIEIKAQAPPIVTIKFVDVRGGGLFDNETVAYNQNLPYELNKNNPYSIFFMLPRPLFKLTVKGFYGNPVNFCLYMISWDGIFNSETGNFEITAKFLGYTFAFLQDIKVGHLLGAGNTLKGRQVLAEVSAEKSVKYNTTFPALTLDDLMFKFNRITVDRELDQKDSDEFNKLRTINEQIKYVSEFKSYLGSAASPNIVSTNFGSNFGRGILDEVTEQVFFRDVGIINPNAADNYNNLKNKIIVNGLKEYNEFREANKEFFNTDATITSSDVMLPDLGKPYNSLPDALSRVNTIIDDYEPSNIIPEPTIIDFSGRTQGKWPIVNNTFNVIDMYKIRKTIDSKLNNLFIAKNAQEEIIKKQLNEKIRDTLGFEPTIKNIMGILCNNVEMFLRIIRDTGVEAQKLDGVRYEKLGTSKYYTDIPDSTNKIYPFPQVVDKNNGEEKYLEEIPEIKANPDLFPEIKLVQNMADGQVAAYKQLQYFNTINNTNNPLNAKNDYFPIFPGDKSLNPYQSLDGLPMEPPNGDISKEIISVIIRRAYEINLLSQYTENNVFNKIAELEAINFNDSLITHTYNKAFSQLSEDQSNSKSLLQLGLQYGLITVNNNDYDFYLNFDNKKPFDIQDKGDQESSYRIWNDDIKLREGISKNLLNKPNWQNSFSSKKLNTSYSLNSFDDSVSYCNKNYFSLKTFKLDAVKTSILNYFKGNQGGTNEELLKSGKLLKNYNINELQNIKINNQNLYFHTPISIVNPSLPFTQSSLYIDSISDYAKGYLILSSFIFDNDKILLSQIENDVTKLIRVPKYFLLWLGAAGYRNNNTEILVFNNEFPAVAKDKFYYLTTKESSVESVTPMSINNFTKYFEEWILSDEFQTVKNNFEKLFNTPNLNSNDTQMISSILNPLIFKEADLVIYSSDKLINGSVGQSISQDDLKRYLSTFMSTYYKVYKTESKIDVDDSAIKNLPIVVNDMDIKQAYYNDLKHIYDTWIAGTDTDRIFTICGSPRTNQSRPKLIDYFDFVDKFRSQIAGDTVININSFNDLVSQRDRGLFGFISKLLTDCYFMHFTLPVFVNFNSEIEVKKMFEPQTTLEHINNNPLMLCVYNGPSSTTLKGNTQYRNDSFSFNDPDLPTLLKTKNGEKDSYMVAFDVNYGSQTQSIFKNINLTTGENRITGEYITLLSNYVLGTGPSKPVVKDSSIFSLMRSRSYTSTIEMMGNMLIQPQMYYQLNNVPFFEGAYMIMNVVHSVRPNYASTTFKGVRQTKTSVKIVTESTSYLNFQFNEGIGTGFTFENKTQQTSIKNETQNVNPVIDQIIQTNYRPITGIDIIRQFSTKIEDHSGVDIRVDKSNLSIYSVNSPGLIINPNDTNKIVIQHNKERDGFYYYTGYFNIDKSLPSTVLNVGGKQLLGLPKGSNLSLITINNLYYHFEVRRSTDLITDLSQYYKLPPLDPQTFSALPMHLLKSALHNNIDIF